MSISTETILKAILDHAPQNIVLMDQHHKIISYNKRIRETLFHYHNRYIEVGDDYRDFVVEMAMPTYMGAFEKALRGEITEVDLETVAPDFRLWFHYRVIPVYDSNGALLGVSLSAEDINQRKLTQESLIESEAKFRTLVEQSLVGVFILRDSRFVYVNPAFERMLAADAKQLGRSTVAEFVHDDDVELFFESCRKVLEGEQDTGHLVVSSIRADGAVRTLAIDLSLIRYNGDAALLGSALDITERIDEEIRINEAVDRGQEMERTQISMELHDNVKQQLVAIALNLQLFQDMLPEDQAGRPILDNTLGYLQQVVNEVRKLSHRLSPAVDAETRLFDKLTELTERMNVKGKLTVSIDIEDSFDQSYPHLQLVVYRIIQEQFSNIIKYANASAVSIHVYKQAGELIVAIADDGIGFDLAEQTKGVGLQNIRRRVQVLGGSVQVQSTPAGGFALMAAIPL